MCRTRSRPLNRSRHCLRLRRRHEENGAHKQTIGDRLAEEPEFDPTATNDDRVMAALAYASQLIFPIGLMLPIIILVSETSKQRPFQRYHAIQSLAVAP